ncbi:glycosyltransferase, partial [Streptococcus danieliae]|nr:glycosyltransferase [Streptococcus danieliae]
PVKGYDMLLQVASRVLTDNPQWKWSICGDGDATIKKQLEDFVEKNDLQGRVILHDKVSDMSSIYRDSAIYVLTSRNEGLPLVLLE